MRFKIDTSGLWDCSLSIIFVILWKSSLTWINNQLKGEVDLSNRGFFVEKPKWLTVYNHMYTTSINFKFQQSTWWVMLISETILNKLII